MKKKKSNDLKSTHILEIGEHKIKPGETKTIAVPVPGFSEYLPLQMQIKIIRAKKPGPRFLITSVVHGDEIIGVEIIHDLLDRKEFKKLERGDVIIIPIVNVPGFINNSRYLPDRRDLNRSFPGGEKGSLAGRLAYFLNRQILSQCTHAIDLHAGAINHFNLPQIRVNLKNKKSLELAKAFAPAMILNSNELSGSFREQATAQKISMLLFEGSEAGRFDAETSNAGCEGILNILKYLKMIPGKQKKYAEETVIAKESHWIRAPETGIFYFEKNRGERVKENERLGYISDPLREKRTPVISTCSGMIIGQNLIPVVHEGDALFNIACI